MNLKPQPLPLPLESVYEIPKEPAKQVSLDEIIEFTNSTSLLNSILDELPANFRASAVLEKCVVETTRVSALVQRKIDFILKYKISSRPAFIKIDFDFDEIKKIRDAAIEELKSIKEANPELYKGISICVCGDRSCRCGPFILI